MNSNGIDDATVLLLKRLRRSYPLTWQRVLAEQLRDHMTPVDFVDAAIEMKYQSKQEAAS